MIVLLPAPADAGLNELPVTPGPEKIPPVGVADNCMLSAFLQMDDGSVNVSAGTAFTVISTTFVDEQPSFVVTVYEMDFNPATAIAGSNVLPLTPAPEKLPPAGVALKVMGVALLHISG